MTYQSADVVRIEQRDYELICEENKELFSLENFGLEPEFFSTACWRDYLAEYAVRQNFLILEKICVGLRLPLEQAPPIGGKMPRAPTDDEDGHAVYDDLDFRIDHSGGILIGMGEAPDHYFFDLPHPLRYTAIEELVFERGRLIRRTDISGAFAALHPSGFGDLRATAPFLSPWILDSFSPTTRQLDQASEDSSRE